MAAGEDWSVNEVEAAVVAYFDMLRLEIAGTEFNKAERNRQLRERLDGRALGSVEFKHEKH